MLARILVLKMTDISTTQTFDICSCDLIIVSPGTKRIISLFKMNSKSARSFSFMTEEPTDSDIAGLSF